MKKGSRVFYKNVTGSVISAIVRTLHKDDSATVEACFVLHGGCYESGPYLGYKFRLPVAELRLR